MPRDLPLLAALGSNQPSKMSVLSILRDNLATDS